MVTMASVSLPQERFGALLSAALKGDQVEGRTIGVVVFRAFLQIM
jgi:hypothetical protein